MPEYIGSQPDVDIDLKQLFAAIWQRRYRILALTVAVSAIAYVGANVATPSYQGEARLLIEPRAAAFSKTEQAGSDTQPLLDELNIASQVQVLNSADLIKQVAKDLNLIGLPEFDKSNSTSQKILSALHLKKPDNQLSPEDRVVDKFIEKLQVYQVEKSRVIGIQFTSEDPKLSAAIPNKMMEVYSLMQSDAKIDSNFEATQWLEPEIATLRKKVEEAEKKVADYRTMKDIPQAAETTSLAAQQLKDISQELAKVRSDGSNAKARAEAVRAALSSGGAVDTLAEVSNSAMMQKLKESESNIKSQIADLSITLLNNHPKLKGLRSQLGGIQAQIRQETTRILSSIENEAKVAKLREAELVRQFDAAKVDAARAGEEEVGLKALEREATAQRQLLETYLARYREAASRSGKNSSPADARVISKAIEPREPTFPKILPITLIAALGTIIMSSVVVLLIELFSGRALKPAVPIVPAADELKASNQSTPPASSRKVAKAAAPLVASLPEDEDEDLEPPVETSAEPSNDEFSIEQVAEHLRAGRIGVAYGLSPTGDDGSAGMVMLAREVAARGRSTIVVDLTATLLPTRMMAVDRYLPGVTDLLCGDAAFGDAIHSDTASSAHILPHGRASMEQAMGVIDRLTMIINALADVYDVVLIECGSANAEALSRFTRHTSEHIILSMPNMDEEQLQAVVEECTDAGYSDFMLLSDPHAESPKSWFSRKGKSAA